MITKEEEQEARDALIEYLQKDTTRVYNVLKSDLPDGRLSVGIVLSEDCKDHVIVPLDAFCQGCYVSSPANEYRGFVSAELDQKGEFVLFYEANYFLLKFAIINSIRNGCDYEAYY